ncbi:YdbL family protein [Luteimonas sp BLCC-B24]|uniref:YdbL family protein n=1 Tax=Luteimonas sp. BLCC-B24 TaxID=3025317 RepID=UPI00234DC29A|nr:YdbL family protein [Luteimonas sp. BLCC-B24]MDC7808064.1 YdbL family protein [Luteimonas sp. BLCC-B24]
MTRWTGLPIVAALALTACVTINVYFPAAEAKEAAREFVENVIGEQAPAETAPPASVPGGGMVQRGARFDAWMLLGIGSAQAQTPDITIRTPAVQAIQSRMEQRFNGTLRPHFDSGALGFGGNGQIVVRDASQLPIKDRVAINAAVADDNRDRQAVYREIAVANGHPEWEAQIRDVFARQWIASARPGWWYQQGGSWQQK